MHSQDRPRASYALVILLGAGLLALCVGVFADGARAAVQEAPGQVPTTLGPADGHDLPPIEIERVAVGTVAPDFSLRTIKGDTLTLSSFRGQKNVILVFYRGHW